MAEAESLDQLQGGLVVGLGRIGLRPEQLRPALIGNRWRGRFGTAEVGRLRAGRSARAGRVPG